MATAAIDPTHLLESRMFSQVLNLYVANTAAHFITSTLTLLCTDRLCDFCVALQRRASSESFFSQSSRGDPCDSSLVLRQGALVSEIREQLGERQTVVLLDDIRTGSARAAVDRYRREIMEPMQVHHTLLVFLHETNAPASLQFTMNRGCGSAAFQANEIERVETLRRYIENAWSLLNQRLATRALIDGISVALRDYHRGTLMLDSRFRIVWHNRAARECLQSWRDAGRSALKLSRAVGPLPPDIFSMCEHVCNQWNTSPSKSDLRKSHQVQHAADPRLVATVKLYGANLGGLAAPSFVVQFENQAPSTRPGGKQFVDFLTSGEREVAGLLRTGMSNQEIADQLGKTVVAIKFHLHRIFKKAEVKNRARLILRLTETSP